jgi:hypothetical protein
MLLKELLNLPIKRYLTNKIFIFIRKFYHIMNNELPNNKNFRKGAQDYFYLQDRNYPQKGTLKLVGDRYKLSGDQRTVLYRGISSTQLSNNRKIRLVKNIKDKNLFIDGYNVLFTILNYRLGRLVFISTDGILRDAGSLHGKIRNDELFYDCITLLFNFFAVEKPAYLNIFLDSPVSHSAKHKNIIDKALDQYSINGNCKLVKSPDLEIKQNTDGIICSSDTDILDRTGNNIADIPRAVLEKNFSPELFNIENILNPEKPEI